MKGTFKACFAEGEAPLSLKGALPEGLRNLPGLGIPSQSLEQDIQNWILSKMISFSLATTSKRSNAPGVAFYPSSGMRHTATSMPVLTLGK